MQKRAFCCVLFLFPMFATAGPTSEPAFNAAAAATKGMAALDLIEERLPLRGGNGLFAEDIHPAESAYKPTPAFCWSVGVQLTALTAAARFDPDKYLPAVSQCVDALDQYWSEKNGIGGYDDGPHPRPPDRYYDDNAWIALGLVEAYEVGHEQKYLDRAVETLKFVLSGEDSKLDGGLYWREIQKETKNTCSNAPGVAAALRVYSYTHDPAQLAAGVRLYAWTTKHLRDDTDSLYYDNVDLAGHISKSKWSYNTALMIRSGCLLYQATGDATYLHDAQRSAASAAAKWFNAATGASNDPSYFIHLLAEALLDLSACDHDPRWSAVDHKTVDWVETHLADPSGAFPERWGRPTHGPIEVVRLINQASAARAMLRAARPDDATTAQAAPLSAPAR
jgi:rhamnogalacturonyl hydrolase YesR